MLSDRVPLDFVDSTPEGTALLAYRGSMAHGMYTPSTDPDSIDDIDLMGIVVGRPEHYLGLQQWGSRGTKEFWQGHYDCVFYEIKKAVALLLAGNPNILSILWLRDEHYLLTTQAGEDLRKHRNLFVGKHIYHAFAGYASTQLKKMVLRDPASLRMYLDITAELKARGLHPNHRGEKIPYAVDYDHAWKQSTDERLFEALNHYRSKGDNIGYMGDKRKQLVLKNGYDSKNAAHCIRLLKMCLEFLATGELTVHREGDRDTLLSIKYGQWTLTEVQQYADVLFYQTKAAFETSKLPEQPNHLEAEELLIRILQREVSRGPDAVWMRPFRITTPKP